jgi:hypothetical protein
MKPQRRWGALRLVALLQAGALGAAVAVAMVSAGVVVLHLKSLQRQRAQALHKLQLLVLQKKQQPLRRPPRLLLLAAALLQQLRKKPPPLLLAASSPASPTPGPPSRTLPPQPPCPL